MFRSSRSLAQGFPALNGSVGVASSPPGTRAPDPLINPTSAPVPRNSTFWALGATCMAVFGIVNAVSQAGGANIVTKSLGIFIDMAVDAWLCSDQVCSQDDPNVQGQDLHQPSSGRVGAHAERAAAESHLLARRPQAQAERSVARAGPNRGGQAVRARTAFRRTGPRGRNEGFAKPRRRRPRIGSEAKKIVIETRRTIWLPFIRTR